MDYSKLFENQPVVSKLIKNSFDQGRLFHTYLFAGPKGSLKMDAAMYLASLVLCKNNNACGKCEECGLIDKWRNPHLFILSPDGESIKKEQIEDLEHEFAYSSEYSRVFVIRDIDKATLTSANTLLKFLEELPDNCFGVLLTESLNKVLPTIRSRSQIVNFLPIKSEYVCKELISRGVDSEKAKILSKITNNLSLALKYNKDKDIERIIGAVKGISQLMEEYVSPYIDFIGEYKFLLTLDKDKARIFLDLLLTIQSDKINFLLNRKDKMVFESIEYTLVKLNREMEIEILEILLKYRERIDTNANLDMLFTEMFVEIGKEFK